MAYYRNQNAYNNNYNYGYNNNNMNNMNNFRQNINVLPNQYGTNEYYPMGNYDYRYQPRGPVSLAGNGYDGYTANSILNSLPNSNVGMMSPNQSSPYNYNNSISRQMRNQPYNGPTNSAGFGSGQKRLYYSDEYAIKMNEKKRKEDYSRELQKQIEEKQKRKKEQKMREMEEDMKYEKAYVEYQKKMQEELKREREKAKGTGAVNEVRERPKSFSNNGKNIIGNIGGGGPLSKRFEKKQTIDGSANMRASQEPQSRTYDNFFTEKMFNKQTLDETNEMLNKLIDKKFDAIKGEASKEPAYNNNNQYYNDNNLVTQMQKVKVIHQKDYNPPSDVVVGNPNLISGSVLTMAEYQKGGVQGVPQDERKISPMDFMDTNPNFMNTVTNSNDQGEKMNQNNFYNQGSNNGMNGDITFGKGPQRQQQPSRSPNKSTSKSPNKNYKSPNVNYKVQNQGYKSNPTYKSPNRFNKSPNQSQNFNKKSPRNQNIQSLQKSQERRPTNKSNTNNIKPVTQTKVEAEPARLKISNEDIKKQLDNVAEQIKNVQNLMEVSGSVEMKRRGSSPFSSKGFSSRGFNSKGFQQGNIDFGNIDLKALEYRSKYENSDTLKSGTDSDMLTSMKGVSKLVKADEDNYLSTWKKGTEPKFETFKGDTVKGAALRSGAENLMGGSKTGGFFKETTKTVEQKQKEIFDRINSEPAENEDDYNQGKGNFDYTFKPATEAVTTGKLGINNDNDDRNEKYQKQKKEMKEKHNEKINNELTEILNSRDYNHSLLKKMKGEEDEEEDQKDDFNYSGNKLVFSKEDSLKGNPNELEGLKESSIINTTSNATFDTLKGSILDIPTASIHPIKSSNKKIYLGKPPEKKEEAKLKKQPSLLDSFSEINTEDKQKFDGSNGSNGSLERQFHLTKSKANMKEDELCNVRYTDTECRGAGSGSGSDNENVVDKFNNTQKERSDADSKISDKEFDSKIFDDVSEPSDDNFEGKINYFADSNYDNFNLEKSKRDKVGFDVKTLKKNNDQVSTSKDKNRHLKLFDQTQPSEILKDSFGDKIVENMDEYRKYNN